jgi:hypothetical protein
MMAERWEAIPEYDGKYEVSNMGNVRSLKGKTKLLQQKTLNTGYLYVSLTYKGKSKNKTIHRLVANAFLDKVEGKTFVNHIDGNKKNNNIENLEWVTRSENMKHAYRNGLFKNFVPPAPRFKSVVQYDKDGECVGEFSSMTEASARTGTDISHISSCCKGKRKTANGYGWKYKER